MTEKKIPIHGHGDISASMQATLDSLNRNCVYGAHNPHNISAYYGSMAQGLQRGELATMGFPSLSKIPKSDLTVAMLMQKMKEDINSGMGVPSRLLGLPPKYMHPKETAQLFDNILRKRKMIKYLDQNFHAFCVQVFNDKYDDTHQLITAHHDKIEQYRDTWEEAGLDFNVCAMIYLLTFTSEMKEPKHTSEQWVMDNYNKYMRYTPYGEVIKEAGELNYQLHEGGMTVAEIVEAVASSQEDPTQNPFITHDKSLALIAFIADIAENGLLAGLQHITQSYPDDADTESEIDEGGMVDDDNRLNTFKLLKALIMELDIKLTAEGHDTSTQYSVAHKGVGSIPSKFTDRSTEQYSAKESCKNSELVEIYKDGEPVGDQPSLAEIAVKAQTELKINFLTFDEIGIDLMQTIEDDDKAILAAMKKDDLISLHHTLGQYIRNQYHLWDEKCGLTMGAEPSDNEEDSRHPDDVSFKLIEAFWAKLQEGKPVE